MAHVLDLLEDIKKYLYVRSREQDDGHIAPDVVYTSKIRFQTCSDTHSAGILSGQQSLMFAKYQGHWVVDQVRRSCYSKCLLTQCEHNDLKLGDVAYMSSEDKLNFENLYEYYIILNDDRAICWRKSGEIRIVLKICLFVHIFKVAVP